MRQNFLKLLTIPLILAVTPLSADVVIQPEFNFAHSNYEQVRLSPDGEYIAAITTVPAQPDARNLVTMRLSDNVAKALTGFAVIDVASLYWVNDDRLVFSTDNESDQNPAVRVYRGSYTIQRDGTEGRPVQHRRARQRSSGGAGAGTALRLLHRLPTDWNNVLITAASPSTAFPWVFTLDVETGRSRKVVSSEARITNWIADNMGNVRAAVDTGDDVLDRRETLMYRDTADDEWQEVIAYDTDDLRVLAFHVDNRRLIVLARVGPDNSNRKQNLYLMNLDGKLVEMLLSDDAYDVGNLSGGAVGLKQTARGHLVYYQYMAESLRTVYFEPRWQARQEIIDEALADTVNTIIDWSDDERQLLVHARIDADSGDYFLFDTTYQELRFLQPPDQWVK